MNIKFSPTSLESGSSLEKFVQLLKTYLVDLEGFEVRVNIFSAEMLREARQNPEKFQDLIIRIAGYSVYFVELLKEIQDDIIARIEHAEV